MTVFLDCDVKVSVPSKLCVLFHGVFSEDFKGLSHLNL